MSDYTEYQAARAERERVAREKATQALLQGSQSDARALKASPLGVLFLEAQNAVQTTDQNDTENEEND